MASGLLTVTGSLDLSQFWPSGQSDADTTRVQVSVQASAFRFRPHPGAPDQVTRVFDNAEVRGAAGVPKPCLHNGQVTVRLQGVDAPELHYIPTPRPYPKRGTPEYTKYLQINERYRQRMAETATIALAAKLSSHGPSPIPVRVESHVDEPNEVFDTYARLVGDIVVTAGGASENINHWLIGQGWALPSFYSSMSREEIEPLIALADQAWQTGAGCWPYLSDYCGAQDGKFDFGLICRPVRSTPDPAADAAPFVLPKLFRRLSQWAVFRKAGIISESLPGYLESLASSDSCFLTDDFLTQGPSAAELRYLHEFVAADGYVAVWPEQIVFREKPSKLIGPGGGVPVW